MGSIATRGNQIFNIFYLLAGNEAMMMETECLDIRFPGSPAYPVKYNVKLKKTIQTYPVHSKSLSMRVNRLRELSTVVPIDG